jgi:hypothetical protein
MGTLLRNLKPSWWISITSLITILALAFGAQSLLSYLSERNASTFQLNDEILGVRTIIVLLLPICLLLLAWFVLIRSLKNVWVAFFFSFIGLLIILYPSLSFAGLFYNWLPRSISRLLSAFILAKSRLVYYSGGFIAATGLLALCRPRSENSRSPRIG